MSDINRFSSRRQRLDHAFLSARLKHAKSYKRIAGYFRSSIFELVGEEIATIPKVQIVCNSELDAADVAVSKHVRETALKERWNEAPSEVEALLHRDRYRRLHHLLASGRVEIRVVPKDRVFIHGKAGDSLVGLRVLQPCYEKRMIKTLTARREAVDVAHVCPVLTPAADSSQVRAGLVRRWLRRDEWFQVSWRGSLRVRRSVRVGFGSSSSLGR